MLRFVFLAFLLWSHATAYAQPYQVSLGIFSGITTTYSWDEGIFNDPRYQSRYDLKLAPIGISYGVDYTRFGFAFTPGLINIGQHHHIINNVSGHEGTRTMNLKYLQVPFALKVHVIDLAFFRISFMGGAGAGFLLDGEETVSHNQAKYRFPMETYPHLPDNYIVEYDGVLAPHVSRLPIVTKEDYNRFQAFAFIGFRSDWDLSENWRTTLDLRVSSSVFDSRNDAYLARIDAREAIYDMPGKRRDLFATLTLGFSRFIEIDEKKMGPGKEPRRFKTQKNPFQQMRKKERKRRH